MHDNQDLIRQTQEETHRKSMTVVSDYFRDCGMSLKGEDNRLVFLLVGAAILGTALLLPLGTLFLDRNQRWVMVIPGAIILLLAFGLRWRRLTKAACLSDLSIDRRPCNHLWACWGTRSEAEADLKSAMLKSQHEIFIAGACLTTLRKTFADSDVVNHVVLMCTRNSKYNVTALVVGKAEDYPSTEKGRKGFATNLIGGRRLLQRFMQEVNNKLPRSANEKAVETRVYGAAVWPRHFILKADSEIFVGSYLCHEEGSYSYLLKLRDSQTTRSLYNLFINEIKYLIAHSEPFDISKENEHGI